MSKYNKTIYLVRHAKSSWKDASLGDRDRPLNKRGQRAAPDMGQRMARQGHKPSLIISSPANRALTTAKIIAGEIGYDVNEIDVEEKLYFSGQRQMLKLMAGLDNRHASAMMVGHNPAMTWFMNYLGDTSVANMPTCAIAIIGFQVDSWADVLSTRGTLLGYDFPKGTGDFTDYLTL